MSCICEKNIYKIYIHIIIIIRHEHKVNIIYSFYSNGTNLLIDKFYIQIKKYYIVTF